MTQVLLDYPPNYDKIEKAFDLRGHQPIFAFSPSIYNPHHVDITPALVIHERVHISRQWLNPEPWWDRYLAEDNFRLSEEILAHIAEYKFLCAHKHRGLRRAAFQTIAERLCSPLYGYKPPLSESRAKTLLKIGIKQNVIS